MTPTPPTAAIHFGRDYAKAYHLDIVRDDLSGLGLPSSREEWRVLADTTQGAHKTVDYHFGRSVLWYRMEESQ